MHLWNDSSEGGSSPQEIRYAQLIRNPEQSRVECGIFWVWGALSLPLLTWECWELDRVETDTPILALRWTWFWEGGLIFFLKRAADSGWGERLLFLAVRVIGRKKGVGRGETVQRRLSRILTVATVCVLYELDEVGLIHNSLLTNYKEPQRVWRKFVKSWEVSDRGNIFPLLTQWGDVRPAGLKGWEDWNILKYF